MVLVHELVYVHGSVGNRRTVQMDALALFPKTHIASHTYSLQHKLRFNLRENQLCVSV